MLMHDPKFTVGLKSSSQKWAPYFNVALALIAGCVFAYFAGRASENFAHMAVQAGGPSFLREPLNAGIALLLFAIWQKWRPGARFSSPKWGHVVIGLILGLIIGVALPGFALLILSATKNATIAPPTVNAVALVVPFIFLIVHSFAEESLVRGIAQREGHYNFGSLAGVGLAAICFAALQAWQGYNGVWELLNAALFGAILGFLALGSGGIWTAIGAHAGWSYLETAVLGQPGQIVKTQNWLAGSGSDSYGSPAFTLVLMLVLGVQFALHLKAQSRKL